MPTAVKYFYKTMFEEKDIPIMAYTLETILAEKYETILRRNIGNTRMRDFYDLYVLFRSKKHMIRRNLLKIAVMNTAEKRNSYAGNLIFSEVVQNVYEVGKYLK